MWILIIVLTLLWLLGLTYLIFILFYRLTKKEVFVPFVPADTKGIDEMCQAVALVGTEKVIDVGSGWGSIVFHLARKYQNLRLYGIELNPVLHFIATLRKALFHRGQQLTFLCADAGNVSYSDYDVIMLFMLSPFVDKVLVPKFEKELKKGAKVVSYVFPMKSKAFTEKKITIPAHGWRSVVYVYTKD